MTTTAHSAQVNDLIARALTSGKCPPAAESIWRSIGEKDLQALESLFDATPANPTFAKDVCASAERAIDDLMHPILNDLMNARATIDAFGEAAMRTGGAIDLYWPSLMASLKKVTPRDDDLDNAITQIYGVVEKAVTHALQAAAAAAMASAVVADATVDGKQDATRRRDRLVARTLETAK